MLYIIIVFYITIGLFYSLFKEGFLNNEQMKLRELEDFCLEALCWPVSMFCDMKQ